MAPAGMARSGAMLGEMMRVKITTLMAATPVRVDITVPIIIATKENHIRRRRSSDDHCAAAPVVNVPDTTGKNHYRRNAGHNRSNAG